MKKILFCKYNTNRASEFQTKTLVSLDNDILYVEKRPLNKNGEKHIQEFVKNYDIIKGVYSNIELLPVEKTSDGVRYPYVEGKSIDDVLSEVSSWKQFFEKVKELKIRYFGVNPDNYCNFTESEEFIEKFGAVDCSSQKCIKPCNLDLIFDNIIIREDGTAVAFDYEWVCNCAVPELYVNYRIFRRLYDRYYNYFIEKCNFEEFLYEFEFSKEDIELCEELEKGFLSYVFKGGVIEFPPKQYQIDRMNLQKVRANNNVVDLLHDTEKKYLDTIDNLNTAVRIKEEVEEVLHGTEKKYLDTIDNLNTAIKIKEEVENVLHDTEKKYLDTISNLNSAVKIKEEVEDLLHDTEKKYLDTINELNKACQMYEEAQRLFEETNQKLIEVSMAYHNVVTSKSWRITRPLRGVNKLVHSVKNEGVGATTRKVAYRLGIKKSQNQSQESKNFNDDIFYSNDELMIQRKTKFNVNPIISIITPLFNTPKEYLIDLLESLRKQTYNNWQLCLVNFSDDNHKYVDEICADYASSDARYDYYIGKENHGISENTNECISYATGEYIGLLDHDDVLHESALYEVVKIINEENADFIYTDEIKFEDDIRKGFSPNYKPDFSADELRAHNYICHFCVYSRDLYNKTEGYRKEFDGSQDHDIVLRLTEKAEKIVHIPRILYFWRVHPGSVASGIEAKSYATEAGEKAVTEQFTRLGINQYATSVVNNIPLYRFKSNDKYITDLCTAVIWGITKEEEIANIKEIFSLNNIGISKYYFITTDIELMKLEIDDKIIFKGDKLYGNIYNEIMSSVDEKYVLFASAKLNDLSTDVIKEIALYSERDDISTIDAKIISEGKIVSGGLYVSGDENMLFKVRCMGASIDYSGYENAMIYTREVSASAGMFTVVNSGVWKLLNGFDENMDYETLFDYSYRAMKKGYHNLWTPFIEADVNVKSEEVIELLSYKDINKMGEKDPFVSDKVFLYGLE